MFSSLTPPFSLVAQLLLGVGFWMALVCFAEMVRTVVRTVLAHSEQDETRD